MNDKPTPTPTEADISCATAVARLMFDNSEEVGYECMVCANETIARHVAASVDRATAELRDTIERCESVIADIRRENETRRIDFTAIIRSNDSTVSRLREALRLIAEQCESRRPPAWCQIAEQSRSALGEQPASGPSDSEIVDWIAKHPADISTQSDGSGSNFMFAVAGFVDMPNGVRRYSTTRYCFESLWDEINAPLHPWSKNEYVFCYSFRVLPKPEASK